MPTASDETIRVRALGLRVHVAVDDARLREHARYLWGDCADPDRADPDYEVKVSGRGPWHIASDAYTESPTNIAAAIAGICAAVNAIVATCTPLLAVHAAVVRSNGSSLLIPGRSGAGKTTIAVALLQAGWDYVTDEAFAIDWETANAESYPRPLGVSDWTARTLSTPAGVTGVGERFLRARDLGARVATDATAITHVVLLDRKALADTPSLSPAHRVDALGSVVEQGFTHYYDPEKAVRCLTDVILAADVWRLSYGDPVAAAQLLSESFAVR